VTAPRPTRRETGRRGEELAARWYLARGYEVLDRNWCCREGEIDLVARSQTTLVFCEVKARSSDRFGTGLESVPPGKRRRLRRLAGRWLAAGGARRVAGAPEVRFDVASLTDGVLEVVEAAF